MGMHNTLAGELISRADLSPDLAFIIDGDSVSTYGDVRLRARSVAAALLGHGYVRGDRLAVIAPNQSEWIDILFGAASIGVAIVALNVRYRETELRYMLNQSGARGVVCVTSTADFDFAEFFEGFRTQLPAVQDFFFLGRSSGDELWGTADPDGPLDESGMIARPEDPAVILYTSGTTGQPKGAILTHQSLLASARAQAEHLGMSADTMVGNMPLNHVGGLTCTVLSSLVSGGTVALIAAFSPAGALSLIENRKATIFAGVPTMWQLMLNHELAASANLDSLRIAIIGGSNVDAPLAEQMANKMPSVHMINLYGMSETSGGVILSAVDDDVATVSRTLGVIIGGFEHRVVDAEGNLTDGDGELQIRGGSVAAGYWDDPEQSANAFLSGGWLATGDVVATEADGHIVFRSRRKEMYIQGGYNVYPAEVEAVLSAYPGIALAAGIGIPDVILGEVGRYFVVLANPGPTSEDLMVWCSQRLANYKVPREIVFVDQLPLTPAGKIHKAALPRD